MRKWKVVVVASIDDGIREYGESFEKHVTTERNTRWLAERIAIADVMLEHEGCFVRIDDVKTWSEG